MEIFYLLCLIPLTVAVVAKIWFRHTISWLEFAAQGAIGVVFLAIVYFTGTYSAMADTEIHNGRVTQKVREHDSYIESYSCNCRSVKVGKTSTTQCSTCYRTHYTVDWYLKSTIGNISIDSADWTSRAVYALPNPSSYDQAVVGEHCAKTSSYSNYIKAAPDSIFHNVGVFDKKLTAMVPEYPYVRDIYKRNNVLTVGISRDQHIEALESSIDDALKNLGKKKQVNINVVIANTDNRLFRYALEREWLGGKKNDVTVVIGAPEYPNIKWVQAFTFANSADNNLLTTSIRNELLNLQSTGHNLTSPQIVANMITQLVDQQYRRKSMEDFEYLKDSIEPPTWVLVLSIVLSILLGGGLTYYFHHNEIGGSPRRNTYRSNYNRFKP